MHEPLSQELRNRLQSDPIFAAQVNSAADNLMGALSGFLQPHFHGLQVRERVLEVVAPLLDTFVAAGPPSTTEAPVHETQESP